MGGKAEGSVGVFADGGCSLGGEPPEARARSAGGLYLAPMVCSASSSLALLSVGRVRWGRSHDRAGDGWEGGTYRLAKAAEGAGGGVLPEETREKELSLAESDMGPEGAD